MIQQIIKEAFHSVDLTYDLLAGDNQETIYNFKVSMNNIHADCYVEIREDNELIILRALAGNIIPSNKKKEIAEYMAWLNYRSILGNFNINMESGEYEFRNTMFYDIDSKSIEEKFMDCLKHVLNMLDDTQNSFMKICYANTPPKDEFLLQLNLSNPKWN